MKKRLFIYITLIISAGLLCFFAASVYITRSVSASMAKDMVTEAARICADLYDGGPRVAGFGETRITVIASDGAVLADSSPLDIETMDNHLGRPEVQAALNGAPEAFTRYSETLGTDLIYYAVKAERGDGYIFIRAAIPVAKADSYYYQSLPLLAALLLLVAWVSLVFSRGMLGRVIKPFETIGQRLRRLADGKYESEPMEAGYEELEEITREIDEVSRVLHGNYATLREEESKMKYILDNIGDAIFAAGGGLNVALINNAALEIFNVTPDVAGKNINYLTYDRALLTAVKNCAERGESFLSELTINGRIYLAKVKKLPETEFTLVVLSDVTENRENAKRREEFFANASHELKTPLTAIKGFNELASINNKDENIIKFIGGITRETDRMLSLIGNMLKLSELESASENATERVSLYKTVNEARESLSVEINEKSLIFEAEGDAIVEAEPGHVYELIKNIAENAVRYNNAGKKVSVIIENGRGFAKLTVKDDGIGIAPEEQTRIFERFYRVEKSRSQLNGGTGLGLSIVKHICARYGWRLSLSSRPGAGTEVTVIFGGG